MELDTIQPDTESFEELLKQLREGEPAPWMRESTEKWTYVCKQLVADLQEIPVHEKPATEQELFSHQLDFYKNEGDLQALEKMFICMVPYAGSLILKFKKHRNFITKKALKDMSFEVAFRVIDQFLNRPGFTIGASFAGYIKWKILEVTGEADDFERAKQIDPTTGLSKVMPLLSLNAIMDSASGKDVALEDLQEKLNFKYLGGSNANWYMKFDSLYEDQTILGVMKIVDTLLGFLEDDTGDNDYKTYNYKLFATLAIQVLFSSGMGPYQRFLEYSPSTKLSFYIDESIKEVASFLRDTGQTGDEGI